MPMYAPALLILASIAIRKALTYLVLPLGICFCLLLCGLITGRRRFTAAALAVLVTVSTPLVSDALLRILEQRYPRLTPETCSPSGAIVVLGGTVTEWRGGPNVEWTDAVDRFEAGVRLIQAGKAPRLILGGGTLRPASAGRTEAQAMRRAAIERGVPSASIRLLHRVAVTADEANAVKRLARAEGFRRVILVTSAFHLPRAVHLFERAGLDVTPYPADYLAPNRGPLGPLGFVPRSEALYRAEIAFKEFYGIAYYRLLGAER